MAEVPAVAIFIAITQWHFKVLTSKQAATVLSNTQNLCSQDHLLERVRVCPGRTAQKASILKQCSFYPAVNENQKACSELLSAPFKCFVAGPLNELQGFAAKAESGSLS